MGKSLILAIDTSCDETAAAVTEGTKVLSNIVWSQASLHAKFGGIYPSLARRMHEKRIDWVIEKALLNAKCQMLNLDAVAVTVGPGLAIALEVGIKKAKEICKKYRLPLISVNHVEGHLLSALAERNHKTQTTNYKQLKFPALGIVLSGGTTEVILIKNIGNYESLAKTRDDALGEALDKGARLLGLGYPGGAILEKIAEEGKAGSFSLPVPLSNSRENYFSYSGVKTAFVRLITKLEKEKKLNRNTTSNLAASYQDVCFKHILNVLKRILNNYKVDYFFAGGGVMANKELRKRIRKECRVRGIKTLFPYSINYYTDNAAMIGIAAGFKLRKGEVIKGSLIDQIDRIPRLKITDII